MVYDILEPALLWKHFEEISAIPRESKNEEGIREHLVKAARKRELPVKQDKVGNVLIEVPATKGHEDAPIVILQGHMDMVCEKNTDVEHDFATQGIQGEVCGDWVKAKGTTLGADNGIGMAAALAMMDDKEIVHGPLELLFTVDEETGLTGAFHLEPGFVKGRILLNLDSEDEGELTIGCAGGGDTILHLPLNMQSPPSDHVGLKVSMRGLKGGHSGVDIHMEKGNAVKLLARALNSAGDMWLADINGGNKHNAIPREAFATIAVESSKKDQVKNGLVEAGKALRAEFKSTDPELTIQVEDMEIIGNAVDVAETRKVLGLILALPHGVIANSKDMPGVVETSNNVAVARFENDELFMHLSSRSSVATALDGVREQIKATAELVGATVEQPEGYPGWQPNVESEILKVAKSTYQDMFGVEPNVAAIHAGLECGIIQERYPGMDSISFGPTIQNPHSPDERVNVPTVEKFWKFLGGILREKATTPSVM